MRHLFKYLFETLAIIAGGIFCWPIFFDQEVDYRYLAAFVICFGVALCLKYLKSKL